MILGRLILARLTLARLSFVRLILARLILGTIKKIPASPPPPKGGIIKKSLGESLSFFFKLFPCPPLAVRGSETL